MVTRGYGVGCVDGDRDGFGMDMDMVMGPTPHLSSWRTTLAITLACERSLPISYIPKMRQVSRYFKNLWPMQERRFITADYPLVSLGACESILNLLMKVTTKIQGTVLRINQRKNHLNTFLKQSVYAMVYTIGNIEFQINTKTGLLFITYFSSNDKKRRYIVYIVDDDDDDDDDDDIGVLETDRRSTQRSIRGIVKHIQRALMNTACWSHGTHGLVIDAQIPDEVFLEYIDYGEIIRSRKEIMDCVVREIDASGLWCTNLPPRLSINFEGYIKAIRHDLCENANMTHMGPLLHPKGPLDACSVEWSLVWPPRFNIGRCTPIPTRVVTKNHRFRTRRPRASSPLQISDIPQPSVRRNWSLTRG